VRNRVESSRGRCAGGAEFGVEGRGCGERDPRSAGRRKNVALRRRKSKVEVFLIVFLIRFLIGVSKDANVT